MPVGDGLLRLRAGHGPVSLLSDAMRTTTHAPLAGALRWAGADGGGLLRVGLHLLLAALPLLAISAHVFGLIRMQLSAALLVVPLATALLAWTLFAPHTGDRVIAHGFVWGIVACAVYDVFRLDTVYMLGWWGDFIPTMGTWITGDPENKVSGAIVGYLWRYIGDGGGIGITFFALASAFGLHQRSRATVVGVAVAFAVFPVWSGLIATVALASRGQTMMFPLTPTTVTLSLIGHLIFGLILGLGFWRSRAVQEHWPWAPLTGSQPLVALPVAAPPWGSGAPAARFAGAAARPGTAPGVPPRTPAAPLVPPAPAAPARSGAAPAQDPPSLPRPRERGTPPRGTARAATPAAGRALDPHTGGRTLDPHTGGQTLDPHTWELWQRQIDTTVRGRRTHGARR